MKKFVELCKKRVRQAAEQMCALRTGTQMIFNLNQKETGGDRVSSPVKQLESGSRKGHPVFAGERKQFQEERHAVGKNGKGA
ncbi:hypothetical protein CEXT_450531 [Caerostris extrusa]|uniref:Uncharacterized protein n=1 Tax=Caerostris extrusa TaxID=172846 RepID=A0AAV4YD05_CAEEX|nr:hypothetical protein CEXT_450531 [Caerostris extrusa]